MAIPGYKTIKEACEEYGLEDSTLRHAIRDGRLEGHKVGNTYLIADAEIERYQREKVTWRGPREKEEDEFWEGSLESTARPRRSRRTKTSEPG